MSCTGPHVVITGASTGIGRSTVLRLAADGYHVYAGVRRPQDGDALRDAPARRLRPRRAL
jgi:NAD(P)-dependent dehydrogenase (short-subunit alcohol dehydrogenase family)